jgi:hypothetical protein
MWSFFSGAANSRRLQAVLLAWLPPALLVGYAVALFVLPAVGDRPPFVAIEGAPKTLGVNRFLFWGVFSFVVATALFMWRGALYRVVEGYSWPSWLREWRVTRAHEPQRAYLEALRKKENAQYWADVRRKAAADASKTDSRRLQEESLDADNRLSQRVAKLAEADNLRRRRGRKHAVFFYPRRPLFTFRPPSMTPNDGSAWLNPYPPPGKLLPTRVGNAFRAMETYGSKNLGLDSQILWGELISVAPESLREASTDAELHADTMLAGYLSSLAFTTLSAWALIDVGRTGTGTDVTLVVCVGVGLLTIHATYRALVSAARTWGETVRAIIVMGREPLREHMHLKPPKTTSEEKLLWSAVTGFVYYGDAFGDQLDLWREGNDDQERDLPTTRQPFALARFVMSVLYRLRAWGGRGAHTARREE